MCSGARARRYASPQIEVLAMVGESAAWAVRGNRQRSENSSAVLFLIKSFGRCSCNSLGSESWHTPQEGNKRLFTVIYVVSSLKKPSQVNQKIGVGNI